MSKQEEDETSPPHQRSAISRRQIILGAATAAIVASIPTALSATGKLTKKATISLASESVSSDFPVTRYMLASVCMADGRIMVSGGYSAPPTDGVMPIPLTSAMIVDSNTGTCTAVAPMNIPRARHAMVALRDGRVVVLGGMSMDATASVEVYDPRTNQWQFAEPLDQPRYDHCAVFDGSSIYIVGGSSQAIVGSMEVIHVYGTSQAQPL